MSDHKNDDQQEFEAMFQSSGPEQAGVDDVVEVIDTEEVASPSDVYDVSEDYMVSSSSKEEFSDIDDGIDEDDEAGIFADSPPSRKTAKTSSFGVLLFSAAALAVVGAGGYFYLKDPEMLDRIKSNFSGGGAENAVSVPSFELTEVPAVESDMPPQPPQPQMALAENTQAVTPDDVPAVAPDIVPDDVPPEIPAEVGADADVTLEGQVPVQSMESPPAVDGVAPPDVVDVPAEESGADHVEAVAPVVEEAVSPTESASTSGEAKVSPVEQENEPNLGKTAQEKSGSDVALVDNLSAKVPGDGALVPVETPKTKEADHASLQGNVTDSVKEEESVYYDSPSGKILSTLPAPSMDVKRGNGESLIVVTPSVASKASHKKTSSKSATTSSKMVAIETKPLDGRVVAAGRALKLGRYDAALEMYEDLYKLNPRDARILMGRAVLFQKLGQSERAISTYEELLAVDPSNTEAIVNLAGLIRKDHPAVALSKLLDLREKYPDNAAVAAQLGVSYADSGNLQDAYKYLSLASSLEPDNAQHYFNMAIIAERARDIPKAISMYEKALETDAVHGSGRSIPRDQIYDRLTRLRGQ